MTADPRFPSRLHLDATRATPPASADRAALPRHDALSLTGNGPLAEIALGEQVYTLRITRAGKLILTK
ncbi:hemin uptake protein HemP [Acidimangrovimonas sediminis]|uniref:hemin uptake protein HemP n=1 Tax=Acidimangrovimonas sediminis TaxID=2056283 RepID=UPI000C80C6CA|nr:hemin uptake protein HemP [Acidimangrovimonas sediminis]